jgi:hypothetical protein
MAKKDFKDYICRPYCMFFKEGEKEEMACKGAQIAELLFYHKRVNLGKIPNFASDSQIWKKQQAKLEKYVCCKCSFQAEDCDFQSSAPADNMEPCGGFILLACLMESNLIDESALETMA